MIYLTSGIYGHYEALKELLKKVNFSEDDSLFVVGDTVDYGPEGIEILQDFMMRDNVFSLLGDHEYGLFCFLNSLRKKEEGELPSPEETQIMMKWLGDGGAVTAQKVQTLSEEEREDLLDYLEEMDAYLYFDVNDVSYLCVHAGLQHYEADKNLDDYDLMDMIMGDEEAELPTLSNAVLVTGHAPVRGADGLPTGSVDVKKNAIRLNCGASCGGRLGMICLDTGKCYYSEV